MTRRLLAVVAAIAAMVTTLSAQRPADAAEIKVLASNGARGALSLPSFRTPPATSWRWISTSSLP